MSALNYWLHSYISDDRAKQSAHLLLTRLRSLLCGYHTYLVNIQFIKHISNVCYPILKAEFQIYNHRLSAIKAGSESPWWPATLLHGL